MIDVGASGEEEGCRCQGRGRGGPLPSGRRRAVAAIEEGAVGEREEKEEACRCQRGVRGVGPLLAERRRVVGVRE